MLFGEGISREGDVLDLAVANNIVDKSGAWYSYKGERIGQGRENTRKFLKDNFDVFAAIDKEVREKLKVGLQATAPVVEVPAPTTEAPTTQPAPEVLATPDLFSAQPVLEVAADTSAETEAETETEGEPIALAS